MNNTIRKSIQIPTRIVELNEKKATRLGLSFNAYLKYLLTKNVEQGSMVSDIVETLYQESLKEENRIYTKGAKPSTVLKQSLHK